jgi:hypothetical protein
MKPGNFLRRKNAKRQQALHFFNRSLNDPETPMETKERLKAHIAETIDALNGVKKVKKSKTTGEIVDKSYEGEFIEIYRVSYGYVRRTERKKLKGKGQSTKKLKTKRQKTLTLLRTVANRPGLLQRFREGKEGISPKHHTFSLKTKI